MAAENEEKKVKRSVSLAPEMLEAAQRRADKDHGGNLSRYVQELIERDLTGLPKTRDLNDLMLGAAEDMIYLRDNHSEDIFEPLISAAKERKSFAQLILRDAFAAVSAENLARARRAYDFLLPGPVIYSRFSAAAAQAKQQTAQPGQENS